MSYFVWKKIDHAVVIKYLFLKIKNADKCCFSPCPTGALKRASRGRLGIYTLIFSVSANRLAPDSCYVETNHARY